MYYNSTSSSPINLTGAATTDNCSNCSLSAVDADAVPPRWALVALVLIPVWILCGNLLVLLAVLCQPSLRTLSNCVIASLAVTDFLLALLVVPLGTYQVVNGRWDLGLLPCLIWTGCDVFLSTTSIMHLCAIAIHRFLGISYPLHVRSNQGKKHIFVLLFPVWFISFAISLPLIVQGARNQEHVLIDLDDLGPQCGIFDHVFAIYSSVVSFFLPLSIMIVADTRSVQILRRNSKVSILPTQSLQRSRSRSPCSKDTSAYELTESEVGSTYTAQSPMMEYRSNTNNANSEQNLVNSNQTTPKSEDVPSVSVTLRPISRQRSKSMSYIGMLATRGMVKLNSRERRAEKTLIWVFVCFVVLWLPFFCTNLTYGICKSCNIPTDLFLLFTWLGYISSGVNPCIYTFLNKDFRNAFKKLLMCKGSELRRKATT